jgi:hypothetical protein
MSTNYWAVEEEDANHWNGVFLGKRVCGWVFQFAWHGDGCICHCDRHHYRNIDELTDFLHSGYIVKNEFGQRFEPSEFLQMAKNWPANDDFPREPQNDSWEINGYFFVRGNWS